MIASRRTGAARRPETLSSSVRRGALWSLAATMLLRLSGVGITAITARIMDPNAFGVFAVALTAYVIVSALNGFGISSCLTRGDLDPDSLAPTMVTVSILSSLAIAAVMVFYARPIAAALGSADAANPVRVMAITIVASGICATPTAQCVREFKQDKIFLANAIATVPSTAVLLVLAKSGNGAMAFAWSRVVGQLIAGSIITFYAPRRYLPGMARNALSVLFAFGLPYAGASFVSYILQNIDYALIGRFAGTVILGTYVLAFNTASWSTTLLGSVISGVSMPAFSRVRHDPALLQDAIVSGMRAVALVAVPLCTIIMVLSRPIVLTVYGSRWQDAASVLPVLTIYGAVSIICLLFSSMLAALGRTRIILGIQLVWLFSLGIAMWIGVRRNGIMGAAEAHVIVVVLIVLPCYLIALRRATVVRVSLICTSVGPVIIAGLLAALVSWLVVKLLTAPTLQLLAGGVSGSLVYLLAVFPLAVTVLWPGLARKPRIRRILRAYDVIGPFVGLETGIQGTPGSRRSKLIRTSRESHGASDPDVRK